MIEIGKGLDGRTEWVALDKIDFITAYPENCEIWVGDSCYDYPCPLPYLARAIKSGGKVCGEMRFITLED